MSIFGKLQENMNKRTNNNLGSFAGKVVGYEGDFVRVEPQGRNIAPEDSDGTVLVTLEKREKNGNAPPVSEFHKGIRDPKMVTPVGGVLHFENCRWMPDGSIGSGWINLLAKEPDKTPVLCNAALRISPALKSDGTAIMDKMRGVQMLRVDVMMTRDAVKATTEDELRAAYMQAIETKGLKVEDSRRGAVIGVIGPEDDKGNSVLIGRTFAAVGFNKAENRANTADDAFELMIQRLESETGHKVEDILNAGEGIAFEVMPSFRCNVTGVTAQAVEQDKSRKITPSRYVLGQTKEGRDFHGFRPANIALNPHKDGGQLILTKAWDIGAVAPADGISSVVVPNARQQYLAKVEAAKQQKAEAGAENSAETGAANSAKSAEATAGAAESKGQAPKETTKQPATGNDQPAVSDDMGLEGDFGDFDADDLEAAFDDSDLDGPQTSL